MKSIVTALVTALTVMAFATSAGAFGWGEVLDDYYMQYHQDRYDVFGD